MKGQILDYTVQTGAGAITAENGARFNFSGSEWRSDGIPVRGTWVDFQPLDDQATAIYKALSKGAGSGASPLAQFTGEAGTGNKSKPTATLLGIFLGGLGAHKFYMGSWGWGLVYLITSWSFIPLLLAYIESIRYILMTDAEFYAKAAEFKGKGPFGFFW